MSLQQLCVVPKEWCHMIYLTLTDNDSTCVKSLDVRLISTFQLGSIRSFKVVCTCTSLFDEENAPQKVHRHLLMGVHCSVSLKTSLGMITDQSYISVSYLGTLS